MLLERFTRKQYECISNWGFRRSQSEAAKWMPSCACASHLGATNDSAITETCILRVQTRLVRLGFKLATPPRKFSTAPFFPVLSAGRRRMKVHPLRSEYKSRHRKSGRGTEAFPHPDRGQIHPEPNFSNAWDPACAASVAPLSNARGQLRQPKEGCHLSQAVTSIRKTTSGPSPVALGHPPCAVIPRPHPSHLCG